MASPFWHRCVRPLYLSSSFEDKGNGRTAGRRLLNREAGACRHTPQTMASLLRYFSPTVSPKQQNATANEGANEVVVTPQTHDIVPVSNQTEPEREVALARVQPVRICKKRKKKAPLPHLSNKRRRYNDKEIAMFVSEVVTMHEEDPDMTFVAMAQRIRDSCKVYGSLTGKMLGRYYRKALQGKPRQQRGRKINEDFEAAVLQELVLTILNKAGEREISANVCYSYRLIQAAARRVRERKFPDDPIVAAKKFTGKWVQGWLKRQRLRRRRVTSKRKKNIPSRDEIKHLEPPQ